MATNTRVFTDIDLNFRPHPLTGDIVKRVNDSAIKASVRNLVLTNNYERPFHSDIGAPLRRMLFELPSPLTKSMIERTITDLINTYEPRVVLTQVQVTYSHDTYEVYVRIEYKIVNTSTQQTVEVTLERTR
jgi:phage baseplate assembly protein W